MDQLPEQFPPGFKPSVSIVELPSDAPIEDILSVLDRDGGIILNDLVSLEELASIEKEIEKYTRGNREDDEGFFKDLIPEETVLVGALVGKSDTMAKICEHPVLEELRREILTDVGARRIEGFGLPYHYDPLLSVSLSMRVNGGCPRQRLHRDDGTHLIEHESKPYRLQDSSQFSCLIAGVETTQENGATMFIPGSHRWDDKRNPRLDEVTFAGMYPALCTSLIILSCLTGDRNETGGGTHFSGGLLAWCGS
jgi:swainsonine biosynthesis dioxygenase SwnH1/2